MGSLTVIIPSRNEEWLNRTIEGVVTKMRGDTSVIAVMDGAWPVVSIPNHPKVHLVYHPTSIGQRAAVNEAVRIATSDYVMKLDAHCDVDEGFDLKLMDPYETGELSRDVTTIPRMYNLHAFDWQCRGCGTRTYQGPMPVLCKVCEKTGPFERVIVWQPRMNRLTDFARFDCEPHFQYFSAYKHRPAAAGELPGVMSSVGACCFMRRDRWWELGGVDEEYGSWGSFGIEIACKSWLSGGQQIVNKRTWFSHLFRTQPGFSFPYHMPQKQAGFAKARAKKVWFGNEWPGQTRPLSWLIDHFAPVPGWHEPEHAAELAAVNAAGAAFTQRRLRALETLSKQEALATPMTTGVGDAGEKVASRTVGLCGVDGSGASTSQDIVSNRNECRVGRVATLSVVADSVIEIGDVVADPGGKGADQPRVHETMDADQPIRERTSPDPSVSVIDAPGPFPASGLSIDVNLRKQPGDRFGWQVRGDCEILGVSHGSTSDADAGLGAASCGEHDTAPRSIPQRGVVFISDSHAPPYILVACRDRLFRASEGIPIVSVTLKPIALGRNIVLPLTRSRLTMFKQWLEGLETSTADVVWFAEHDCLYPCEHFHFAPPRADRFYYDQSVWRVHAETGRAVTHDMMSVSGLCAYRPLLLNHYRKVVADVEANGYDHSRGYEPGIAEGLAVGWRSEVPYVDIRHGMNLTASRWDPREFHDKDTCRHWTEADGVPGWGTTKGRFDVWLQEQW